MNINVSHAHLWMKNFLWNDILTIMRIFLFFICIGLSSVYANYSYSQTKIDIDVNDLTYEELFSKIQSKTEYIFFYKDDILDSDKRVSLKFTNATLSDILNIAFSDTDLSYVIKGKQVVVKKRPKKLKKRSSPNNIEVLQKRVITGNVVDSKNQPLPGVNILVEGTTNGTQTDFDGNFQIQISEGAVLLFSYLGMLSQSVTVGDKSEINITMKEDAASLDEVVVVGYGTQSKESITGSVAIVKGDKLEQEPVSTFEQSLRGSMAGLQASAQDGAPGGNTQIRIRGIGSITASSEPLYVIDGIPIQAGSIATNDNGGVSTNVMSAINPNDIESVSVLKDAASTAIYGSRGANGVILITTKSGKAGKAKITFNYLTGFNSIASKNILKPLNAAQYTQLFLEGYTNKGDTQAEARAKFDSTFQQLIDPSTGRPTDTNWLDAITRTGITKSYDLSVGGGTENLTYFFSGAYFDQESYIIGSDFRRLSARANLEYKANEHITISNNMTIADLLSNTFDDSGSFDNPFKNTLELSPLIPIYDDSGRYNSEHINYFPMLGANPVGSLNGDDLHESKQIRIIDNFAISIIPVKNLTFRSQWNFDVISLDESQYKNPRYGEGQPSGGYAYNSTVLNKSMVGTQTLNYNLILGSDHKINVLAGYEAQKTRRQSHRGSGTQFPNDKLKTLNSASAEFAANGARSEYTFVSIFSRANYNYAGKYFLSSSIRRDGSSRFGEDNRWGTFYSFGASWVASNEEFFKDISFIDLLKVRGSWGQTGNAAIGDFTSQGLYTYGQDYDGSPGGSPSQIGNPNLTWETQNNFNIGLDFDVFSRIRGTVEYFKRVSSDLILDVPISRTTGFTSLTQNFGEMSNSGMELTLNADIINKHDFRWSLGFNTTFLKNKITKLTENYIDGEFRREEGKDFQSYYLFAWAGVDQSNGDPLWYTDELRTTTTNNLKNASKFLVGKSATPDFYGGFNTTLAYKGLSLDANFIYSYGNYLFDGRARGSLADGRLTPRSTATWIYDNRWVPGKTDALAPKFIWGGSPGSGEKNNSRWLYDGSYIRVRDITLAYSFPQSIASYAHLNSLRLYLRGTNMLTFTKDKDLYIDPEQSINGNYNANTPAVKTISIGLDIQL